MFLSLAHAMKNVPPKFRAPSNIGNVLLKTKRTDEALQVYNKQIMLAKASKDRPAEAAALASIGMTYRLLKKYDRALGYHTQELTVYEENSDIKGDCRAHGNLGAVHISLGNYTSAIRCYQEMLERAKQLKDSGSEAHAYGNLGIARMNLGNYHDAINHFKQQLSILDSIDLNKLKCSKMPIPSRPEALLISQETGSIQGRARAYCNIGSVYETLGNYEQALWCQEQHLNLISQMESKAMGTNGTLPRNSQGQSDITKVAAYGNIGRIHNALGNNIQAIAHLQQALQFADKMAAPVKTTPKFREEESKIRYLVGLALWRNGDLEAALVHLEKSADIIDQIRNQVGNVGEYALSLFDRQIAAYQALQQILVPIGRTDMTLLMAERTRTLANATLKVGKNRSSIADSLDMIDSVEALIQRVDRIGSAVLYFSTAGTYLHSWLLIPGWGIVKFHETCVNPDEEDRVENNPELA